MQRMTTLDAGFFFAEHASVPMHLGALAVFEGPAPSYQEFVDLYAARLSQVPRYRQVVRTAPLQVFRPAWADDAHFELGRHVRRAVVRPPGEDQQLTTWQGRSTLSHSTEAGRCGKRGCSKAWRRDTGRSCSRCTTAWRTASAEPI
jgi:hypothetical protein